MAGVRGGLQIAFCHNRRPTPDVLFLSPTLPPNASLKSSGEGIFVDVDSRSLDPVRKHMLKTRDEARVEGLRIRFWNVRRTGNAMDAGLQ